ncbi:MAG: 2-oxoacid:acceptor oxidoreductase subunit alpha, partial [Acidobacteria bacterium]|nr:2-oxoacid:acceptor oxidoreductase subunit alpha [Acidobacteriota bacterium]
PAEIKGGACMMQLRVSEKPIHHPGDAADILVALNEEAVRNNFENLREGGTLIYDSAIEAPIPQRQGTSYLAVPFHALSLETVGNLSSKNIVVLGVLARMLGLPPDQIQGLLEGKFKKRGAAILENNQKALEAGLRYAAEHFQSASEHRLSPTPQTGKLLMTGNEAAALGALAAGVDCFFGYPITPSSEIMEYLARNLPRIGGRFLQTEDEISAIAGVCGAAWTGKRAMTATSGPGLSLMSEIVGLLSMAEVPAVIVDSQRGGPSTGLPTKTEQSDLLLAVYGSHGEAPRIVLAPTTVRESFDLMIVAFELAEKYQMPVIVLMDQTISSRLETVDADLLSGISVMRTSGQNSDVPPERYQRFQLTDTGISPRVFPGTPGFEHISTGLEHDETGAPEYDERTHTILSAKRHKKLASLAEDPTVAHLSSHFGEEGAALGIACWGSTAGAVEEAVALASQRGIPVKVLVPKLLHPFVHSEWKPFLGSIEKLLVPEMNFTGQLATLVRSTYGVPTIRLNKLKGVPFHSQEILEMIEREAAQMEKEKPSSSVETLADTEVKMTR